LKKGKIHIAETQVSSSKRERRFPPSAKQLAYESKTFNNSLPSDIYISFLNQIKKFIFAQERRTNPEAGIVTTNSGSPEVDLRFCPWIILFKY
jgi:hypothetical protein